MPVFRRRMLIPLAVLLILSAGSDRFAVAVEESLSDRVFPPVSTGKTNHERWGRDPFESTLRPPTPKSRDAQEKPGTSRVGSLVLTAIISRRGEGAAIINHEIVRKGDRIAGMKIVEIEKERVILEDVSGPVELRLDPFTVGVSDKSEESD